MQLEAKKYLFDNPERSCAAERIHPGKEFADYLREAMLRAAVERELEIIGEALAQLARVDSNLASRIGEHPRIIAFRNILIHGYADVDDRLVWDIVETKLPVLHAEIETLLLEADETPRPD